MELTAQSFTKYSSHGAYHWQRAVENPWWQRSPREAARYGIPLRIVRTRVGVRGHNGVDVGCGDGVFNYMVLKTGADIIGVDACAEGLKLAEQKLRQHGFASIGFMQGSCYELPIGEESTDYVTAIELIEHLEHPETFLDEVYRVLRPDGLFVCTTPQRQKAQGIDEVRDPFHIHEFVADELGNLIRGRFEQTEVLGAYPKWLDRFYRYGSRTPFSKAVRIAFRTMAFSVFNPYVHATRVNPGLDCALLVGIGRKVRTNQ